MASFLWTLAFLPLSIIFRLLQIVIKRCVTTKRAFGFFHPYTNDGGGGERVLWCAVKAIQDERPDLDYFIYTGDHDASPDSLSRHASHRFGVHLLFPPKARKDTPLCCFQKLPMYHSTSTTTPSFSLVTPTTTLSSSLSRRLLIHDFSIDFSLHRLLLMRCSRICLTTLIDFL